MKNKIWKILIILFTVVSLYTTVNAISKDDVGKLKFKVVAAKDFIETIYMNYFDEKGFNLAITLDESNGYFYEKNVPVGTYTVDEVGLEKGYKVEIPRIIKIEKNKMNDLKIVVSAEKHENKKSIKENTKKKSDEIPSDEKLKKEKNFKIGNTGIQSIVIFIILLAVFLVIRWKNKMN